MGDNRAVTTATRSRTARPPVLDPACAAAIDLARAAAATLAAPGEVGEHAGVTSEGERLATHRFACTAAGYRGWQWAVTVARAARARNVTVCEAVLLPSAAALLAPEWVPWSERLRPGDLRPGDLLPTEEDDDRLVPGLTGADEQHAPDDVLELGWQLGLGRARVLSPLGRDDAADRWVSGPGGPDADIAKAAPGQCSTCGFLMPMSGALRQAFGVCANEYSPSDGQVVTLDHGCGAHSEAAVLPSSSPAAATAHVVDEIGYDVVTPSRHAPGSVDEGNGAAEDLGHS